MSDTNFQPIFDYIDKAKDELREEMATKTDIARLENTVNSFASKEITRG